MASVAEKVLDHAAIMAVLDRVPDPEIPALTITDLGIVRGIAENPPRVLVTPT
jgi:ring-1,2-phenylacetyl-CoA epoxidase subunit PaaD